MLDWSQVKISEGAVADARALGLSGDIETKLRQMMTNSTPFSHPRGNRRFSKVMLLIKNGVLQSISPIDVDPRLREKQLRRAQRRRSLHQHVPSGDSPRPDDDTYVDDLPDSERKPIRLDRFVSDDWSGVEMLTVAQPLPDGEDRVLTAKDTEVFRDRAIGCFIGLAIGDALGAPVEFEQPGTFDPVIGYRAGGPFNLRAGEWTDDTSMALGLADALIEDPYLHTNLVMDNWLIWYKKGAYSHNGQCFDIGNQTRSALSDYAKGRTPPRTESAGNGGIMRLAPVVTRWWFDRRICGDISARQSNRTHNNPECEMAIVALSDLLCDLVAGNYRPENAPFLPSCPSTGWVKHTLTLVIESLRAGGTFTEMVLRVVNLGGDSDTAGAVMGMLAGSYHGLSGIPDELVTSLAWSKRVLATAEKLAEAGLNAFKSTRIAST